MTPAAFLGAKEEAGYTLPLATPVWRGQGLVKDAAGMSGCSSGYHPELWL